MTIGIYAGSFDPITYGHSSIIHDASQFCDQVVVAIGVNPDKKYLFSLEERIEFIKAATKDFGDHIVVKPFKGLLVDFVAGLKPISNPSKLLIRGIRSAADYDYEANLAVINRSLYPLAKTILLISHPETAMISSSMVKEVARYGHDVRKYVHPIVAEALMEKFVEEPADIL